MRACIAGMLADRWELSRAQSSLSTKENAMNDHVYRVIELVGSSTETIEDAIDNAIERASKTVRHLDWFEITETRGQIVNNEVAFYQVKLKVGFRIED
jgi:flavin-binding protein dodecin